MPKPIVYGHLAVPRLIGSLRLNAHLTQKFIGLSARRQVATSFSISDSDVVSGFYTSDPSATTFTSTQPRLMFQVAYLSGQGDANSSLSVFMSDRSFYDQHQVSSGSLGGVAACGWIPQSHQSPVAHCMWADANTYADFYAWDSTPTALARTMIATRPQVELART